MIPVTSIPRSSLSKTYHTATPESKARWSSGRPTEKLLWNFKGPLEATYGKQGLEIRAPTRPFLLFTHSRFDHTQKSSKFPKYVNLTICPQRSSTRSALKVEAEGVTNSKKSNSDNTVGGRRTASYKARGTNSSALPRTQPS